MKNNYLKYTGITLFVLFILQGELLAQNLKLSSPNQRLTIDINLLDNIYWNVSLDDIKVIENVFISMDMGNDRVLGANPRLRNKKTESLEEKITVQVPNKDAVIHSKYNQMTLNFKASYQLIFRGHL